jgi:hypothetical protein
MCHRNESPPNGSSAQTSIRAISSATAATPFTQGL